MAPSFLSSGSKKVNPVKHFEIRYAGPQSALLPSACLQSLRHRPDESNLVLRGSREEAPSVLLRGTLVLCLSQPLRIQGIRLRFTGEKRIGYAERYTLQWLRLGTHTCAAASTTLVRGRIM